MIIHGYFTQQLPGLPKTTAMLCAMDVINTGFVDLNKFQGCITHYLQLLVSPLFYYSFIYSAVAVILRCFYSVQHVLLVVYF